MTSTDAPHRTRPTAAGALALLLSTLATGRVHAAGGGGLIAGATFDPATREGVVVLDTVAPEPAIGDCGGDGDCWATTAVVKLAATISIKGLSRSCSKTCRLPIDPSFYLRSDGTYEIEPAFFVLCPQGGDYTPTNVGTWVRQGKKIVLTPGNLDGIEDCVGNGAKYRTVLMPSPTGEILTGQTTLGGHVTVPTQPAKYGPARVKFGVRLVYRGVPLGSGEPPAPKAKPCGSTIVLRCGL